MHILPFLGPPGGACIRSIQADSSMAPGFVSQVWRRALFLDYGVRVLVLEYGVHFLFYFSCMAALFVSSKMAVGGFVM